MKFDRHKFIRKVLDSCKTVEQVNTWKNWAFNVTSSAFDRLDYILWEKEHLRYLKKLHKVGPVKVFLTKQDLENEQ